MQRILLLLLTFTIGFNFSAQAQDDDKPNYYQRPSNPKPAPVDSADAPTEHDETAPSSQQKNVNPKTYSYTEKKFDMSQLLIEPTISFFFTSQIVSFSMKPSVVYDIWKKKLFVGGGIDYSVNAYLKYPLGNTTKTITVQSYGGGPVLHYNIWKGLFARVQPEVLAVRIPVSATQSGLNNYTVNYKTYAFPYMWIGAGYNLAKNLKGIFMPAGIFFDPMSLYRQQNYTDLAGNGQKRYQLSPYGMVYFQIGIYILDPRIGLN